MKIVSTGSTLASEKFLEKKRRARQRRVVLWGALFLAIFLGAVILLRHDKLRIAEIKVLGNEAITSASIISAVANTTSGYYFYLIPKDSTLFYSSRKIEAELLRKFSRFGIAEVTLAGPRTLEVVVAEREPLALYCPDPSQCYFLDETGFIFDSAPTFSDGVYFIYSHKTPFESPLGREFVGRDEFWELDGFVRMLSDLGFRPSALEVGERDISITFGNNAKLLLNRGENFALLLSNLEAFLNAEEIRAQDDFLEKVSELDLRTDNKVFYSFR